MLYYKHSRRNSLGGPVGIETPQFSSMKVEPPRRRNSLGGPVGIETSLLTTVALLEKQEEASPPRSPKKISSYLR